MSRGTDIAAQSLGMAGQAANAVPGIGTAVGAGLGLIGGLVSLFGSIEGPRKRKRRQRREARERTVGAQRRLSGRGAQAGQVGTGGQMLTGGQMPETVMSPQPPTPMHVEDGVQQQTLGTTHG